MTDQHPSPSPTSAAPRRRDRHGRGLAGPLLPASLPAARTRAERFADLVVDARAGLLPRFSAELTGVEMGVEDVPPPDEAPIRLWRIEPAADGGRPRIVVHRRAVESRTRSQRGRGALVQQAVVEAVAELLGLSPETVDPDLGEDPDARD